jgi:hypothetical protein
MSKDIGRVPDGTGLSQAEPQEGLGPPGFDPSRDAGPMRVAECPSCEDGKVWKSRYGGNDPDVWDVPCEHCGGSGLIEVSGEADELRHVREQYQELLFAVARKFEGESRHATALRYIREREAAPSRAASAMSAGTAETNEDSAQGEARQRDGNEDCRDAQAPSPSNGIVGGRG